MTVWVNLAALSLIRAEAGLYPDLETGGLLLGYVQSEDVVICDVIAAGPNAQRTRTTFLPDSSWQTDELAKRYAASGRRHTYLGDWHTHPFGVGALSWRDRRTLRAIARAPEARISRPISLVLVPQPELITVWRDRGLLQRPERITYRLYEV
jgi:integrative and conjugative element protein (TIGR02256 family)